MNSQKKPSADDRFPLTEPIKPTANPRQAALHTFCFEIEHTVMALDFLAEQTPFSKAQLKDFAQKGAIHLQQGELALERIRRLKRTLIPGSRLQLFYHPRLLAEPLISAENPAHLIHDYGAYSLWFKPRGMLSQGSLYGDFLSLPRWVELRSAQIFGEQRQCWQIHRLDRATEGLMLLAHSKTLARKLTGLFEQKQIEKTYLANVWGHPAQASWSCDEPIDGKPALSHFQLQALGTWAGQAASQIQVVIETGRTHQIRKHLLASGLPIIGDALYGPPDLEARHCAPLQLSAFALQWPCPLSHQPQKQRLSKEALNLIPLN